MVGPPTFQSLVAATVLLPERFRGGCSFGAGGAFDKHAGLSRGGLSREILKLNSVLKRYRPEHTEPGVIPF